MPKYQRTSPVDGCWPYFPTDPLPWIPWASRCCWAMGDAGSQRTGRARRLLLWCAERLAPKPVWQPHNRPDWSPRVGTGPASLGGEHSRDLAGQEVRGTHCHFSSLPLCSCSNKKPLSAMILTGSLLYYCKGQFSCFTAWCKKFR